MVNQVTYYRLIGYQEPPPPPPEPLPDEPPPELLLLKPVRLDVVVVWAGFEAAMVAAVIVVCIKLSKLEI